MVSSSLTKGHGFKSNFENVAVLKLSRESFAAHCDLTLLKKLASTAAHRDYPIYNKKNICIPIGNITYVFYAHGVINPQRLPGHDTYRIITLRSMTVFIFDKSQV